MEELEIPTGLESENRLLKKVIEEFERLMNESEGVAGLHLNGDIASWDWLENNHWLRIYKEM